jgi:tetratricopeptide (TPR) repeat protein
MKAGALAKLGRFDEALISVNKGIELAPNFFAGIYNRACIFCLKGDKVNALADLKKAIELNPGIKNHAKMDEDFRSMFEDEDFKNLTK